MSRRANDLTGNAYTSRCGRRTLTVVRRAPKPKHRAMDRHAYWECQCSCGNWVTVRSASLVEGAVRSCGCLVTVESSLKRHYRIFDLLEKLVLCGALLRRGQRAQAAWDQTWAELQEKDPEYVATLKV